MPGSAPFRRFWSAHVDALERHLDRMDSQDQRKGRQEKTRGQTANVTKEKRNENQMTSVYVDDQDKALRFYTEVLGFAKKADFRQGAFRWLTVASPEEPDGTELQLTLNNNPAAKAYQQAIFQQASPRPCSTPTTSRATTADQGPRRRVHDAAHRRDRLDHCDAERHLRQPHSVVQLARYER